MASGFRSVSRPDNVGTHSSPWAGPRSVILIATASTAGNPCDAIGSGSPASPAPWRSRPAAKSGKATSRAVGLLRRSEADLGAAAAARELLSKGGELKFEATKAEREGGHNRDHTQDGMASARKSLGSLDVS